jgi:tellurite resistance protein TerC
MGSPVLWVVFNACVIAALVLDLGIFHRRAHQVSLPEAAASSAIWIALSLGFDLWILQTHGRGPALEFLGGYVLEKSLSLDNIFIFLVVFRTLGVAPRLQHRVLFWGILGALIMRGAMIGIGTALVERFSWVLYLLGAFLLLTGVRLLWRGQPKVDPENNLIVRWARRVFPVSSNPAAEHFFVTENGRTTVTSLFLALLIVEASDLLFAVDSIPAVFGITRDPFIVYSSNVCAILGLRALYFLLAGALPYFRFFDAGLSAVLIFIGGKMLAEPWLHLSTYMVLAVIGAIMGIAMAASIAAARGTSQNNGSTC